MSFMILMGRLRSVITVTRRRICISLLFRFAFSFALMQKKQKIKDNPNGSARLSGQRSQTCLQRECLCQGSRRWQLNSYWYVSLLHHLEPFFQSRSPLGVGGAKELN